MQLLSEDEGDRRCDDSKAQYECRVDGTIAEMFELYEAGNIQGKSCICHELNKWP